VSPTQGSAVADNDTIVTTTDGGKSWQPQPSGVTANFTSVAFVSPTQGWVVGDNGTIVTTTDGGQSWHAQTSGITTSLSAVAFVSPTRGWAVGGGGISGGTILATRDAGKTWQAQTSGVSTWLSSVAFVNPTQGWAVGEGGISGGTILATRDGGQSWHAQTSGITTSLSAVAFVSPTKGWAVGEIGTIVATGDGGQSWQPQTSAVAPNLDSVAFVSPTQGWAVGAYGIIEATRDGGQSWHAQTSGITTSLSAVAFVNPTQGWAVGDRDTIVSTVNGGQTWIPAAYWDYPPPWFYLSILLALFVGAQGLRRPEYIQQADTIANRLISDAPLKDGDFDALNLRAVAEGLSRFFRNINTVPPMTVAIIGDWGFGKSSLMRLLEADLRKNRVRPVWFNAWHHQTEEHLLAYLLEAIRKQAIPPFTTRAGLNFRWRLFWGRFGRYWAAVLGLWAISAVSLGFALKYGSQVDWWNISVQKLFNDLVHNAISELLGDAVSIFGPSAAAIFFFLLALRQTQKWLKPFGVSPAELLRRIENGNRIEAPEAKTSFRMAFADQFRDVTSALPQRMVIFIDDLDRCHPDRVLQILEATNFLVSAGECFVVLGIAKPMVLAAVGLAFKDVAPEVVALADSIRDEKAVRREYARNYLNKLINLEVTVRRQGDKEVAALVKAQPMPVATPAERLIAWSRKNALILLSLAGTAVIILSFAGTAILVERFLPATTATPVPTPAPVASVALRPSVGPSPMMKPTAQPTREPTQMGAGFRPGASSTVRLWWLAIFGSAAALLLPIVIWMMSRRPESITRDSDRFLRALEIWPNYLGQKFSSPREIKRFMNFLRYLAMRSRRPEAPRTQLQRLQDRITGRTAAEDVDQGNREAKIVCMAVLALEPNPAVDRSGPVDYKTLRASKNEALAEALKTHEEKFGLPSPDDWALYDDIIGEVSANVTEPNAPPDEMVTQKLAD
jgi:photosystem II stability/assembly factor-like uncharacterized protein